MRFGKRKPLRLRKGLEAVVDGSGQRRASKGIASLWRALRRRAYSWVCDAQWQRERLYGEIRQRLAIRPDGRLRRLWGAVLHAARATA